MAAAPVGASSSFPLSPAANHLFINSAVDQIFFHPDEVR